MTESNNHINRFIRILGVFCLGVAGCLTIFNIVCSINDLQSMLNQILCLVSLGYAFIYLYKGFGKDSAKYYKNLGILLLASHSMIIPLCLARDTTIVFVLNFVVLLVLFVLVIGENLGKIISLSLCALLVICEIIALFFTDDGIIPLLGTITKIATFFMYGVFTYAKYRDKAMRKSN